MNYYFRTLFADHLQQFVVYIIIYLFILFAGYLDWRAPPNYCALLLEVDRYPLKGLL